MKKLIALLFLLPPLGLLAQDEGLRFYDYVYQENIKSVKFHLAGLFTSMPILTLGTSTRLALSFDDLDGDFKDYSYAVVQCNADWTPSILFESDYIEGFPENDIREYDYSFKTKSIYTNYRLLFPNNNLNITMSGNYLLKVYLDEDQKELAITRRFMVVEQLVRIEPDVVRPAAVGKSRTHQEIDFHVTHEDFEIRSPRSELAVTVLQNGRWDNAITGLVPLFSRVEEQSFDYQDKIVFPAGKEFRSADLRSFRYGTYDVAEVRFEGDEVFADLKLDEKRSAKGYSEREDINGNFVIDNLDETDPDLMSDYAEVLFSLKSPGEMYDQDLYVFGAMTDWQLKPGFKLVYNPATHEYIQRVKLKQGYYNYLYAALPKNAKQPDFEETEGDWYETDNDYTILVYYRPFGGRHDQIIGSVTFNSRF